MSDLTVAIAERTLRDLLGVLIGGFRFEKKGQTSGTVFDLVYDVAVGLEGGLIDLRDDGAINLKEIDVIWERLSVELRVDLPQRCIIPHTCVPAEPFGELVPDFIPRPFIPRPISTRAQAISPFP